MEENFQKAAKGVVQQSVSHKVSHHPLKTRPKAPCNPLRRHATLCSKGQYGPAGFEPAAYALGKRRSIQLSYGGERSYGHQLLGAIRDRISTTSAIDGDGSATSLAFRLARNRFAPKTSDGLPGISH